MASVFGCVNRWRSMFLSPPPAVPKTQDALKFGILGAASIAPPALITPAKSHPEVVVQAVAARDKAKATAYAKKHGIPQVLDSYQALIDDPSIDAVYIPLPNGLHYEWALKALAKGKHVLVEKPSVSNATEAEILFHSPLLKQPNAPVLLEAFHYRFQPSWRYFLTLLDPPNITHAFAVMKAPAIMFSKDDIRFKYDLAGGSLMDLATYPMSALRDVFGSNPESCLECNVKILPPPNELCDHAFQAKFRFPGGATGEIEGNLLAPLWDVGLPKVVVDHKEVKVADQSLPAGQEKFRTRKVTLLNFAIGAVWHRIDIEDEYVVRKTGDGGSGGVVVKRWKTKESKKAYTFRDMGIDKPGEPYWLTYRYQLEEFVNRIRGREGTGVWIDGDDSIAQMKMIDMAYLKTSLPIRPTSKYRP